MTRWEIVEWEDGMPENALKSLVPPHIFDDWVNAADAVEKMQAGDTIDAYESDNEIFRRRGYIKLQQLRKADDDRLREVHIKLNETTYVSCPKCDPFCFHTDRDPRWKIDAHQKRRSTRRKTCPNCKNSFLIRIR